MAEAYPKELNTALKGLEYNGNPWGIGYDKRADWAKGLDVKTMADDSNVDYLLWVGCAGSFDDRSKKVSTSLVKILQKAGISFAILGVEEKCTGDFARKVGSEMLYQMMARENIETLNGYNVKKIIAGGGRMWMEEKIGKRINLERSEEIVGLQVSSVAVGCPFCLTMIEDGMKELGKEEEIKTMDIAEIVEKKWRKELVHNLAPL